MDAMHGIPTVVLSGEEMLGELTCDDTPEGVGHSQSSTAAAQHNTTAK
jgi:hypothetical protein